MNISELMELMGSDATEEQAERMADLLFELGIRSVEDISEMNGNYILHSLTPCKES